MDITIYQCSSYVGLQYYYYQPVTDTQICRLSTNLILSLTSPALTFFSKLELDLDLMANIDLQVDPFLYVQRRIQDDYAEE